MLAGAYHTPASVIPLYPIRIRPERTHFAYVLWAYDCQTLKNGRTLETASTNACASSMLLYTPVDARLEAYNPK